MASSEVPQGTVQDVLDWVGDDPGRARQALDAEQSGQQRTTLITKLEEISTREDDVTDPTAPPQTNPSTSDPAASGDTGGIAGTQGNPASPDAPGAAGGPAAGTTGTTGTTDDPGTVNDPVDSPDTVDEGEDEELPAPEQPTDVALDPTDTGTFVGPVHARDYDVEVPDETLEPQVEPEDIPEPELIEAEQVDYFQVAGGTNGVIVSINGTGFALLPQMAAALKTNLDKAIAGLSL